MSLPHPLWEGPHLPATRTVERVVETVLPTGHGRFRMLCYRDDRGWEHVVLAVGALQADTAPLVRVHSECFTGDCLGSRRCDCGQQLDAAMAQISAAGCGLVIYVRGHEGRGIGLAEKLRAYRLQDDGMDTVDANVALGHQVDAREYGQAALILADLNVPRIRLLSSNPAKETALRSLGVEVVQRVPLVVEAQPENSFYLATKRERMGHERPAEDVWAQLLAGQVPALPADPLVQLYGPLVTGAESLVIAQLGQSLDGFIASRSGDAAFVTGPEDRLRLHRMRALVDAVVVGAGTVTADDCQLTVRDVPGPDPVRVLVDPNARIDPGATVLTDGRARTLWLVGPQAATPATVAGHVGVVRLPAPGDADPATVLGLLADHGLTRVLIEGGGRLVSSFVAARLVDRLYLTTAAILIGDGVPGLRFPGSDALKDALGGPCRRFTLGEDVCTELVLRRGDRAATVVTRQDPAPR